MLTPINFNHQFGVGAIKVHDIIEDNSLAIKSAVFDLSLPEPQPEKGLGLRQVLAQLPGKLFRPLL
jgi:hypothetical protein